MNSIDALQVLYNNLKSHMSRDNPMFDLEYDQIKKDLKFLEILKEKFNIEVNDADRLKYISIVEKEDYDTNGDKTFGDVKESDVSAEEYHKLEYEIEKLKALVVEQALEISELKRR